MLRFFLKQRQLCAAAIAALLITMTACTGDSDLQTSGGDRYTGTSSAGSVTAQSEMAGNEDTSRVSAEVDDNNTSADSGETGDIGKAGDSGGIMNAGEKGSSKSAQTGSKPAANGVSSVNKAASSVNKAASSKAASSKAASSKAVSSRVASSRAASSKAASSRVASFRAASSKPASSAPVGGTSQAYQAEVIRLTNLRRQEAGLPALKTGDARLQAAANIRAAEIVQSFSHTRPNGSSTFTVMKEQGVTYRAAGENIAYGQTSPAQVMEGWMNSQGHRENILNSSFDTICVGHVVSGSRNYWVQLFIKAS